MSKLRFTSSDHSLQIGLEPSRCHVLCALSAIVLIAICRNYTPQNGTCTCSGPNKLTSNLVSPVPDMASSDADELSSTHSYTQPTP